VKRNLNKANHCEDPNLLLEYLLQCASRDSDPLHLLSEKAQVARWLKAVLPICNRNDKKPLPSNIKIKDALEK